MKKDLFYKEIVNSENWQPNYTKISKKTGLAISTIHDRFKKLKNRGKYEIIVRELTEFEIIEKGV